MNRIGPIGSNVPEYPEGKPLETYIDEVLVNFNQLFDKLIRPNLAVGAVEIYPNKAFYGI